MSSYRYTRWAGNSAAVDADRVTFEPSGHVAFWDDEHEPPLLVRAERSEHVNNLREERDV